MIRIIAVFVILLMSAAYPAFVDRRVSVWGILLRAALAAVYYFLYRQSSLPVFALSGILFLFLTVASHSDWQSRSIHPVELFLITGAAVALRVLIPIPPLTTLISAGIAITVLGLPWVLSRGQWVGLADVAVFGSLSLVLEPLCIPFVLLGASLSGFVLAAGRRLRGQSVGRLPFIPLMGLSFLVIYPLQYRILSLAVFS